MYLLRMSIESNMEVSESIGGRSIEASRKKGVGRR